MPAPPFSVPPEASRAYLTLLRALEDTGPAPCQGAARDDWTSRLRRERARAADACLDCRVLAACGTYADLAGETRNVWAGTDRTHSTDTTERETAA